jgi:Ca2+-binding EF-hand superfamily protein
MENSMKSKLIFSMVAGLIAGGAYAQAAPAPAQAPAAAAPAASAPARGERMQKHFAKVDKNADGSIDRQEAANHKFLSKDFDAIDANKDGKLSREELQARHAAMHDKRRAKFDQHFKQADANGDGVLTKAEADASTMPGLGKHFDNLDANKDGKLTSEEMQSAHRRGRGPHGGHAGKMGERIKAADKDGDGALSKVEAADLPRLEKHFDRLDANKDGKLTRDEMHAAMQKNREQRKEVKDLKDMKDSQK